MSKTPSSKRAPRGRPRAFDKEAMLHKIMKEFWARGIAATSLDDLATVTGLSRSSLYAAYGGKTAMYLAAMELFARQMQAAAVPSLFEADNLQTALAGFYSGALDLYFGTRKQALGCMVFTTAVADAASDPKIRKAVAAFTARFDAAMTQCIQKHAPDTAASHATAIAQLASGLLINLAARARSGASRAELDEIAAASAQLVAHSVNQEG